MPSKTVTVGSSVGLHARPAGLIAQAAADTGVTVSIANVGEEDEGVDAGSALMIMTLGAKCGDQVVVSSDDQQALDLVAGLVEQDLDA
jgi:phosphocarrier protein